MSFTRKDVVKEALSWVDTPFVHQARVKHVGVDCAGLLECVGVELKSDGYQDYEFFTNYPKDPTGLLEKHLDKHCQRVSNGVLKPGRLILFSFSRNRKGQHLAIHVGNNKMVHAYSPAKHVQISTVTNAWKHRIVGVYDFKGVTD